MNTSLTTVDQARELLYDDSYNPGLLRPSDPYSAPSGEEGQVSQVASNGTASPPLSDSRANHDQTEEGLASGGAVARQSQTTSVTNTKSVTNQKQLIEIE